MREIRILVSGGTGTLQRLITMGHLNRWLGHLMTPRAGNAVPWESPLPYAADNGAFAGFDERLFLAMLDRLATAPRPPLWVACPDVVGSARETLKLWPRWSMAISKRGLEPAYVLQDNQHPDRLPDARAWFVGGSTAYKESRNVQDLVVRLKYRHPTHQFHMGRCNTRRRLRIAYLSGMDTVDGTGFSRWGDRRVVLGIRWIKQLQADALLKELDTLGPRDQWLGAWH